MNPIIKTPELQKIAFASNDLLSLYLSNDRTVTVPLHKFPPIAQLNDEQRQDFEIIDNQYLSFLTIDNIYSIEKLLDISPLANTSTQ